MTSGRGVSSRNSTLPPVPRVPSRRAWSTPRVVGHQQRALGQQIRQIRKGMVLKDELSPARHDEQARSAARLRRELGYLLLRQVEAVGFEQEVLFGHGRKNRAGACVISEEVGRAAAAVLSAGTREAIVSSCSPEGTSTIRRSIAMPRLFVTLSLCALLALTGGCASLGIDNPFGPGENTRQSQLLGVSFPAGMALSSDHSRVSGGEGVEVAFGQVTSAAAAQGLFNSLQSAGWQLRLQQSRASKGVYVYENGERMAVVVVESQAVQTVVTICAGNRLPTAACSVCRAAAAPRAARAAAARTAFGTPAADAPPVGTSESWGAPSSGGLQEREL